MDPQDASFDHMRPTQSSCPQSFSPKSAPLGQLAHPLWVYWEGHMGIPPSCCSKVGVTAPGHPLTWSLPHVGQWSNHEGNMVMLGQCGPVQHMGLNQDGRLWGASTALGPDTPKPHPLPLSGHPFRSATHRLSTSLQLQPLKAHALTPTSSGANLGTLNEGVL